MALLSLCACLTVAVLVVVLVFSSPFVCSCVLSVVLLGWLLGVFALSECVFVLAFGVLVLRLIACGCASACLYRACVVVAFGFVYVAFAFACVVFVVAWTST